jgi:hypothetical protein
MGAQRALLNGLGIFAAATFIILFFNLSVGWYGAAFLAWVVRARSIYQRHRPAVKSAFLSNDVDEKILRS